MASKRNGQILVGLDIGTTKICAIVGELGSNGLDIIGIGTHPSKGLRKGVVVNIETTVSSIRRALDDAEAMAGVQIAEVFTGIAGGHIKSFASRGVVALKDREVREADIVRVIEQAKTLNIPLDREVIHVLPQEFIVDDQPGIREPLGMTGARLEAKVHIVTGAVASAQNIVRCANRAGLHVADIVLQPLASSESVLTEDEKELGVCLVDIGGGTTDIAVFENGSIVHSAVIALGGNNLTNDVAVGLRTPMEQAELIKQRHGAALTSLVRPEESIEVPSVGGRPPRTMRRQLLSEILEPRVEEIFQLVQHELERHNFAEVCTSGIVITGGTTLLPGMTELAEEVLGVPVRRGVPRGIGGLVDVVKSPIYATGVGLVMYGAKFTEQARFPVGGDNIWKNLRRRFGDWWNEIF